MGNDVVSDQYFKTFGVFLIFNLHAIHTEKEGRSKNKYSWTLRHNISAIDQEGRSKNSLLFFSAL